MSLRLLPLCGDEGLESRRRGPLWGAEACPAVVMNGVNYEPSGQVPHQEAYINTFVCSRRESNPHLGLRTPQLYPLSYGSIQQILTPLVRKCPTLPHSFELWGRYIYRSRHASTRGVARKLGHEVNLLWWSILLLTDESAVLGRARNLILFCSYWWCGHNSLIPSEHRLVLLITRRELLENLRYLLLCDQHTLRGVSRMISPTQCRHFKKTSCSVAGTTQGAQCSCRKQEEPVAGWRNETQPTHAC